MLENEISDAALSKVWHFTIGFARAGETPAAKGSGVLVKYKGLMGILTCGHVDTYVRSLKQPIGLVRFNRGLAEQFGTIDLDEVFSHVAGEEPWERGSDDIAFINLPPHLVGNIAKDCVFLDIERNFVRPDPDSRSELLGVHAVFGLVEAFTGETTRQNKRATTRLRGVLTPGKLLQIDHLNATLECFEENIPTLPDSFGGTSGGGLWRVYVRKRDDGVFEAEHYRLLGIASREDIALTPPQIACQGPGRIEMLLESVHSSS
ncbi:hypothetical protein [Bradyrhizobium sp. LTSP857]|uniref:hypothetical protein n=1 Tax=Bradyrhizobium sp. LTSP857 TaxID=1619231 RepID=UPI0005D243FC|nr:hypothetical protein [Bradyrhizobium sp. LTSP857]KJC52029.1 hypothetical protein UP06_03025 [Bradyrhizobium sp. LTSP857]